jgi:hypothetical protein
VSRHEQGKSGPRPRVRHRTPRRKSTDTETDIDMNAERARIDAALERLAPRFSELADEAMAKRDDHVLLVLDSHSPLLRALPSTGTTSSPSSAS